MLNIQKLESLDKLQRIFQIEGTGLVWPHIFSLPGWMFVWWDIFGKGYEKLIIAVYEDQKVIGIAPLKRLADKASFIGDTSVCDYADFIVQPGKEDIFINVLLDNLATNGIKMLDLETLRPDSTALKCFVAAANGRGLQISCNMADVSLEMELPDIWDNYMSSLESRQRRDVERKLRKLSVMGEVGFVVLKDHEIMAQDLDVFLNMMTQSRRDKSIFLTSEMHAYFNKLVQAISNYGITRLGFLEVGRMKVASVLYFDYNDKIYLYNSGYNPDYADLSVGLISKFLCIREAIKNKKRVFDFLKGAEIYKSRLGGREIALSACQLQLS
jgi:CelD/BcsL family acetyltransferase involved in cellulose biosynthesis